MSVFFKKILLIYVRVSKAVNYRRRLLCSFLIKIQMNRAIGRIYIGKSSLFVGAGYVTCLGNFNAQDRNRVEAIDRHRDQVFNPTIIFGNNVSMEYDCHIGCVNRIEIHENVLIASRVYISDHSHGATSYEDLSIPPNSRLIYSKGAVVIQRDVWIGEGACILPGVTIGHNSIIGANSVVTRDIPPYSIAAGCPAKVIKTI